MRVSNTQQNKNHQTGLYRVVFESLYIKCAVALLFVAFMVQPISLVYADEVSESQAETLNEVAVAEEPEVSAEVVAEDKVQEDVVIDESENIMPEVVAEEELIEEDLPTTEVETDEDQGNTSVPSDQIDETYEQIATTTDVSTEKPNEPVVSVLTEDVDIDTTSGDTALGSSTAITDNDNDDVSETPASTGRGGGTSSSQAPENESNEDQSTSSEEVVDNDQVNESLLDDDQNTPVDTSRELGDVEDVAATTSYNQLPPPINDANRHQFSKDECVAVGDGTFYCSKPGAAPEYEENGVFSVPDADGDMEIMLRVDGEEQFITQNETDDLAPYYDARSERIVWHSMKRDRYQIASYDFDSGKISYLTETNYNNMEPVADGEVTIWQAWILNNWEIMLHDGVSTTQLTDNTMNDISPQVYENRILWQTQFSDGWKIAVYDIETGQTEYIGDAEGALAANPRFVLVYDSLDENGDIETVGFDLSSGEKVPFAQIPSQLPDQLPDPQGSKETRALIQNKSNTKSDEVIDEKPTAGPAPEPQLGSTTTDALTIDLSTASTTSVSAGGDEVSVADLAMRENVENIVDTLLQEALQGTSTEHIDDVIIPPLATSTDAAVE